MRGKKFLAVVLAAAMVMGSTVTAFAGRIFEGGGTGTGTLAGYLEDEVFHIVVPTMPVDDKGDLTRLNFLLDPQELITATNGTTLGNGATFVPGKTLYFPTTVTGGAIQFPDAAGVVTGGAIRYTDTSDIFTVTNKSTMKTNITVTAKLSNLGEGSGEISLSEDRSFTDDTSASMYMAIQKVDQNGTIVGDVEPIGKTGAVLTGTIEGNRDAYKVTATSGGAFMLSLKPDVTDADFDSYQFQVTGASNSAGDWYGVYEAGTAPKLELTWTVVPHTDSYLDKTVISSSDSAVTPVLPEGVTVSQIVVSYNGQKIKLTDPADYSKNGSAYVFVPEKVETWAGGTLIFTYSNGHVDIVTIK